WANVKYQSRMPRFGTDKQPLQLEVSARQFEWRMRYPGPGRLEGWFDKDKKQDADEAKKLERDFASFARVPHQDDVHVINELHCWKGQPVLVQLKSIDVIPTLTLPHFRVKQDALPGKTIPVWFVPIKANTKHNPKTGRWDDGGGRSAKTGAPRDHELVWEIP